MSEKVNHPDHYNQPGKKECIEQMREDYGLSFTFDFCLGNAYKYLYRRGNKEDNSYDQDTAKAKWYFDYANSIIKDSEELNVCVGSRKMYFYIKKLLDEWAFNKIRSVLDKYE